MTTDTATEIRQLLDSPEGRRIAGLRAADALALRRAKAVELRSLEAEHVKALPSLQVATKDAAAAVTAAQQALRGAQVAHGEALTAEGAARGRYERERGLLESDLRATADQRIGEFVREMSELWDRTRRIPISNVGGVPDGRGGFEPVRTNADAVTSRLEAINSAREAAEALRLEALDGGEIQKRLAALRRQIEEAS